MVVVLFPFLCIAQEVEQLDSVKQKKTFYHNHKGFEFNSDDGRYQLQIAARLQFRYATPNDMDPLSFEDFEEERKSVFKINRARLKIGGHAYQPWIKYYFEYELSQNNLLDFKVMIEKWKALSFKVGQWKVDYNRERVISSGEQQMIERSIITRPFTIDRQQGVAVYGNLDGNGAANFSYWVSVLTGNGRGARTNDDGSLMYVARLQWNALGQEVSMSGSDLQRTAKPALSIAVAGATNQSPYTRFSQSGGGQLVEYPEGVPGQYRVKQALVETAFKYRGFSWQHESHYKEIKDRVGNKVTPLRGTYVEAGYFLHEAIKAVPPAMELAVLFADFHPDLNTAEDKVKEFSCAINWFFNEHKNKLTAQYDYIVFDQPSINRANENRFRLQWDISF